jgi:propionate CoA-transferase
MDARIFQPEPMGLREELLGVPLADRLVYDPGQNLFFVNFENLHIRDRDTVEQIRALVAKRLGALDRKVFTIVNYDGFSIAPDLIDEYIAMIKDVVERFYAGVTRYTTSAFLRAKMRDTLAQRGLAPYIYESAEEARSALARVAPAPDR